MEESFVVDINGFKRRVLIPRGAENIEPFWEEEVDKCGLIDRSTDKKYYAGKVIWG
jgi:hypothetical protein